MNIQLHIQYITISERSIQRFWFEISHVKVGGRSRSVPGMCIFVRNKKRVVNIYRINLNNESFETICEYSFDYGASGGGAVSQLCATEEGVFLRRFISSQVGCGWYKLTDDGNVQEWEEKQADEVMAMAGCGQTYAAED